MSLFLVASLTVLGVVTWILWSNGHSPLLVFGACSLVGVSITMKHIELSMAALGETAADGGAERDFGVARGVWGVTQHAASLTLVLAWPFIRGVELVVAVWRAWVMILESKIVREGARLALETLEGVGGTDTGDRPPLKEVDIRREARAFVGQFRTCIALTIEVMGCIAALWVVRDVCFYSPMILQNLVLQHYHRHHHHHHDE